jgi:anti-sigma factor RsiW
MSRAIPDDLDCIVAVEQVTDYLEGALHPQLRTQFEQHLAACPPCVTYLRQLRKQIEASEKLGETKPPPDEVKQKLLELFRRSRK